MTHPFRMKSRIIANYRQFSKAELARDMSLNVVVRRVSIIHIKVSVLSIKIRDMLHLFCFSSTRFMKIQDRVEKSVSSLGFFTLHQWTFANDNVLALQDRLSPEDHEVALLSST